mmetsp:Transcript_32713/g.32422  ORF Transcript_32713/g.32422 Transcript_32713/m.32422 type:complete len:144 (+) Transcript_32713:24-455(+)
MSETASVAQEEKPKVVAKDAKPKAKTAKKGPKTVKTNKFTIDCTEPVDDDIFDIASFEKFLHDRIKVNGRTGNIGEAVSITREGNSIIVTNKIAFSKRYLKYLTKKFLKKQSLRDYIRVIARNPKSYYLRYFNFHEQEADKEE